MDDVYRFHWRDGTTNEGAGRDAADAFNRLGFGRGAVAALDYFEKVKLDRAVKEAPQPIEHGEAQGK